MIKTDKHIYIPLSDVRRATYERGTITQADVYEVVHNFLDVLGDYLSQGYSIVLTPLGTLVTTKVVPNQTAFGNMDAKKPFYRVSLRQGTHLRKKFKGENEEPSLMEQ